MNFKTVKGLQEAKKIVAALNSSQLLRKKSAKEIQSATTMVKAWKSIQVMKNGSVRDLLQKERPWHVDVNEAFTQPRRVPWSSRSLSHHWLRSKAY